MLMVVIHGDFVATAPYQPDVPATMYIKHSWHSRQLKLPKCCMAEECNNTHAQGVRPRWSNVAWLKHVQYLCAGCAAPLEQVVALAEALKDHLAASQPAAAQPQAASKKPGKRTKRKKAAPQAALGPGATPVANQVPPLVSYLSGLFSLQNWLRFGLICQILRCILTLAPSVLVFVLTIFRCSSATRAAAGGIAHSHDVEEGNRFTADLDMFSN